MKSAEPNADKERYQQLRTLTWSRLWDVEVAQFDRATPEDRREKVAVVRAVGVVFSESGNPAQREDVRRWLRALLHDPVEKIRRYAMTAMPKVGACAEEETELLALLRTTTSERERKFLSEALEKIGGTATLAMLREGTVGWRLQTEQKVQASVARVESPGVIRMERILSDFDGLRIHLRGRRGLEKIVRDEVEDAIEVHGKFRVAEVGSGLVVLTPVKPFALADLYALRCFGTVGLVPGTARAEGDAEPMDDLASVITSPLARRVLETFTEGAIRYRLDFAERGHQRGAVRLVVNRAYTLCPAILNDARNAPWTIAIHSAGRENSVELRPRLTPDPRFQYRQRDVPAASHPPLAACLARLAGPCTNEIVWDPFCGSGLELIERALLGGVRRLHGTDRSAAAIAIAEANFAAAKLPSVPAQFTCCDFRDFARVEGLGPNRATLIITNPPLGKRVFIADLRGLIDDLFIAAATVLQPGGRLVFANPLPLQSPHPAFQLQSRQIVDFGGFDCWLEMHRKFAR